MGIFHGLLILKFGQKNTLKQQNFVKIICENTDLQKKKKHAQVI